MVITLKGKCNPSQHNCQLLHKCVIEKAAFQMSLEHLNDFTFLIGCLHSGLCEEDQLMLGNSASKVLCSFIMFKDSADSSLGCTSMSTAEISSDSHPRHSQGKRCTVKEGVTSHAICCHAPSLECNLLENISADKDQVK